MPEAESMTPPVTRPISHGSQQKRCRVRARCNNRSMQETIWETIELFCPVCNATFNQLVVLHKVPKGFKIDKYLAGMVENHDHKAYQAAKAQAKLVDAGALQPDNTR